MKSEKALQLTLSNNPPSKAFPDALAPRRRLHLGRRFVASALLALISLVTGAPQEAQAQDQFFWRGDGGLDGNWNAGNRWWNDNSGSNPQAAGFGQLNFNNNDYLTGTNDTAFDTFRIFFATSADQNRTNGGTGTITFFDFGGAVPVIRNDSSATHQLNMPISIGNTAGDRRLEIIAANGDLSFGGQFTTQNTASVERTLFVTNGTGRLVTMSGVITEANTSNRMRIQKEGSGTLTLSGTGANTHTGGIALNGGTLILNKSANVNAIGSGTLAVASGATVSASAAGQFGSSFVTNNGTLNLNNNSQQMALAGAGTVSLGSATLTNTNAGDDTFSGLITGASGSLVKAGAGTLRLTGTSSTFTGATTILPFPFIDTAMRRTADRS